MQGVPTSKTSLFNNKYVGRVSPMQPEQKVFSWDVLTVLKRLYVFQPQMVQTKPPYKVLPTNLQNFLDRALFCLQKINNVIYFFMIEVVFTYVDVYK